MMEVYPLFSTPIFCDTIAHQISIDYLENLEYFSYISETGFGSCNQQILLEKIFSNVKIEIEQRLNHYLFEILKFNQGKIKHIISWINLNKPGNYSGMHHHENSCYSGVYYLKCPQDGGKLWFHHSNEISTFSSSTIRPQISEYNIFNSKQWFFDVKEGDLLLFPSHLTHYTDVNMSSSNRYCLAFNYFIDGSLGGKTSQLNISASRGHS